MKISIPNPCNESWAAMKEHGCGRFCASCEKTVTDFTQMNDEAFVAYFRNFKGNACGRFTERQLKMEIPDRSLSVLPFGKISHYVAASVFAVAGLSGKVFGQEKKVVQTSSVQQIQSESNVPKKHQERYIAVGGVVVDESNEALIGASISILNSDIGTLSNIDGKFYFLIPESLFKDETIYLKFYYAGFETGVVPVHNRLDNIGYSIKLKLSPSITGGFGTIKETKWQRFKRWVKNNFL